MFYIFVKFKLVYFFSGVKKKPFFSCLSHHSGAYNSLTIFSTSIQNPIKEESRKTHSRVPSYIS